MHALRILRLRASCSCVARMSSAAMDPMQYPFLKPRSRRLGPDNPLLELSKPKARRESLATGLVVGEYFDNRLLTYPEVLDEARSRSIDEVHDTVKSYVDSLDRNILAKEFPAEVKEKLISFGAFGALIPKKYGGQGWTVTEFARVMEAFGNNLTLASIVTAHNCTAAYSILHHGSENLKSKYLPKIASGEYICAFAFTEDSSGSDMDSCKCRARQLVGEEHMEISGEKVFVTNGLFANLFLTAVCVKHYSGALGEEDSRMSIVLVDRDLPGVVVNKSTALRGLQGNGLASVNFKKTRVSNDCVVGEPGDAAKVCREIHSPFKCAISAAVLGALKSSYAQLLSDVGTKTLLSRPMDQDLNFQDLISDMMASMYAIESALYMNAAVEDCVDQTGRTIESSIAGLACMKYAISFAETCVKLYGSEAYEKDHFASRLLRDLNCLLWFYQTENMWKLIIAMTSVKIAGAITNVQVKICRDPLTYPKEAFEILRKTTHWNPLVPPETSPLEDAVHPTLKSQANSVYFCQEQLRQSVFGLLKAYGAKAFEYQVMLSKITDIIRDVYLVTVALSRLNRSVTQGSDSLEVEAQLFQTILERTRETLKSELNDDLLMEASIVQTEEDVFEKLINDGKYTFEHPLMKNF